MLVSAFFLLDYLINLLFQPFLLDMARQYSELEEKYSQGQMDLARVFASLDDANSLNSSLSAQFDSERVANEVSLLDSLCCVFAAYWVLESRFLST
jgi:phage gp36-like protein